MKSEEKIPGKIIKEIIMEPGGRLALEVRKEQVVRIVDIEGKQVADFVCFNLDRVEEKLSPPNTLVLNKTIRLTRGHSLYSDEASKMMTIIEDTVGLHDIIAGACSKYTNFVRYGEKDTPNCRDNFATALAPYGIKWKDIPYNLNIFMNVPVEPDGSTYIKEPISKAGDYIDLQANMNCLVAISNCPQTRNPVNAYRLKPLKVILYEKF